MHCSGGSDGCAGRCCVDDEDVEAASHPNTSGWATWLTAAVDTRVIAGNQQLHMCTRHTSPTFPSSSQHSLSIVSTTHHSIIHKTSNQLTCHGAATPPLYAHNKPSCFTTAAPIVFDALDFMQFLHRMWRRCGLFSAPFCLRALVP
jgi:hypothetical protein